MSILRFYSFFTQSSVLIVLHLVPHAFNHAGHKFVPPSGTNNGYLQHVCGESFTTLLCMKKLLRKARTRLTNHLLKHLQPDRADAATTTEPLGRLNSTLGKCEEMEECFASRCELPLKLIGFFILMENADAVFFISLL